jgi:release factor glutamine methyltransferase
LIYAILSASKTYQRGNLKFHQFDYFAQGPVELQKIWPHKKPPSILAANPPYVPCVSVAACPSPTMYGGPDGIRFVREVVNYGKTLKIPKLALAIGSYSSPREVMRYLKENGYSAVHFSLTPIPFGDYSKANLPHLLELENEGRAILWRPNQSSEPIGYVIVGISAIDTTQVNYSGPILSGEALTDILQKLSPLSSENIFDQQRFTQNQPIRLIRSP